MDSKNVDSERLKKMSDSKKSWGSLHVDHDVKNPGLYTERELIQSGKGRPPTMSYKEHQYAHMAEDDNAKNKAYSRKKNKHENGDIKTSAYIPRPGDNLPHAQVNHAQQKKPALVLRFTQKDSGKFYWHDSVFTIWLYPKPYGYTAVCTSEYGKRQGYGKTAKDSVIDLLHKMTFFCLDAAQNLSLWAKGRISIFTSAHILLSHNPRTPLPKLYQENFNIQHMRGNFAHDMVERPIVTVPSLYVGESVNTVASDAHEPQPDESLQNVKLDKVRRYKKNRTIEPYQTPTAFKPTIIPHKAWHDDKRYKE